ncbi:MAG: FAD-dependent oxidoreductase [Candidatus Omnitrophica bacterium]|nr:FAD-dependent oxidoreductase [Candidatus Omnitrophota bacterium]
MRYIRELERKIPVCAEYDAAVVGGGIAGIAAAAAAARNGVKACIIEKQFALGGLATLGNVAIYLPICDGCGNQIVKGLGEELLRLSVSDGYSKIPACWEKGGNGRNRSRKRFTVTFNPPSFMLALEPLVLDSGADIMYDTRFCGVKKRGSAITHLIIENKDGRSAVACKTVVDASGDADVCAAAEEETVSLNTNVASGWFFSLDNKKPTLHVMSESYDPSGKTVPGGKRGFSGVNAKDVTEQVLAARRMFRERVHTLPLNIPAIPGLRMTRRLKGLTELQEKDEGRIFRNSVGMTGDWRKAGPVYCIPLTALAAVRTPNLVTAGRCISSDSAWDITRAIPACAVTGEAAGTAAALLCLSGNKSFASLDIKLLQAMLKKQNVPVDKKL